MSVVVVATHNAKKAAELHRVLAAAGIDADVKGLEEGDVVLLEAAAVMPPRVST